MVPASRSVDVRPAAMGLFGEVNHHVIERRKRAYRVFTAALRWVIVVGVLVALYFFGIVSSAF